MRSLAPIALIAVLACNDGGLDVRGAQVRILDLEPEEGPLAGGTPVTITGFGFEGDVVAWFGDTPLPTTVVDNVTIVITTPAAAEPGFVDVKVSSEYGSALEREAYEYLDGSGTGPGTGTGTGTGGGTGTGTGAGTGSGTGTGTGTGAVSPTGLTGGLAQYVLTQVACMSCFPGWHPSDVDIWAQAAFHDGDAGSWLSSWPAVGNCIANPTGSGLVVTNWDAGASVDLTTTGHRVTLSQSVDASGPFYEVSGLNLVDFARPEVWALEVPGGADLGAVTIPGAVETPEGFTTLSPVEMLYTTVGFQAQFSRTAGQTITWSPTGNDRVMVTLAIYSSDGVTPLGTAMCADNDDGSLTIPASVLSPYPVGSLLGIYIYRTQTTQAVIPINGHTLEGVAQIGVLGSGVVGF